MKRFFLAFSFLAVWATADARAGKAAAQDLVHWMDEGEAIALSQKTGKALLYNFMAPWNMPGLQMAADVFGNSETAAWINQNFLAVRFRDETRERGMNSIRFGILKRKYDIDAYPTLVVEMPAKRLFHKWKKNAGYRSPKLTRQFLEDTLVELKGAKQPLF